MTIRRVCYVQVSDTAVYKAVSENISRHGMLMKIASAHSAGLPHPGEPVTVELKLPRNAIFPQKYLRCLGSVARVDGDTVAVRLARMATTETPILARSR